MEEASERPPQRQGGARMAVLAWTAAVFIRLLRASLRLRFHGQETIRAWERGDRHFVLAFWHRHLLLMRYAYRGRRMTVLSSWSRDGELSSRTLGHLGIATSRGSTSRGGAAGVRDLLRRARSGSDLALTPDGPRGPLRKVQPGVVRIAAVAGLPVVPVALAARRGFELSSWDRMLVPAPLTRVEVVYGEPLHLPRDADPAEWCPRLEAAINATEQRAERLAGHRGEGA